MRLIAGCFFLLCLPVLTMAQARPTSSDQCPETPSSIAPSRPLLALGAAIGAGGPVNILAVGSATTSGQDSSGTSSFPHRMTAALQAAFPAITFTLTVRGSAGMTATEMLKLLDEELAAHSFAVVFWQTGTVEAVHGVPAADLRSTLATGAAAVAASGSDLVLIGPQYSRLLQERTDLGPYAEALSATASLPGVVLFDRLDLTRRWVAAKALDLEAFASKGERQVGLQHLHACVGEALAQFILAGARPH